MENPVQNNQPQQLSIAQTIAMISQRLDEVKNIALSAIASLEAEIVSLRQKETKDVNTR